MDLRHWTKDSDGDGIVDTQDLCQETTIATEINEDGCSQEQRDDDEDGVANSHDLCPASPYGIPADENGCTDQQVDEDFDGVCNEMHQVAGRQVASAKTNVLVLPLV